MKKVYYEIVSEVLVIVSRRQMNDILGHAINNNYVMTMTLCWADCSYMQKSYVGGGVALYDYLRRVNKCRFPLDHPKSISPFVTNLILFRTDL
jgi:hypothetical protein